MSKGAPHLLPKFDYYLDESDPDVLVVRRQDGAFVGAFSARGATKEGIVQAAEEDYRAMILLVGAFFLLDAGWWFATGEFLVPS